MKIPFQFDCEYGKFKSALVLPDDHTYTDTELDELKQKQFQTWFDFVKKASETTS